MNTTVENSQDIQYVNKYRALRISGHDLNFKWVIGYTGKIFCLSNINRAYFTP